VSFITAKKDATSSSCGNNFTSTPSYVKGTPWGSYGGGKTTPLCSSVFHNFLPLVEAVRDTVLAFLRATDERGFEGFDFDPPLFLIKLPMGSSSLSLSTLRFLGLGFEAEGLGLGLLCIRAPSGKSSSESESSRLGAIFLTSSGMRCPRGTSSSESLMVARIMVRSVIFPLSRAFGERRRASRTSRGSVQSENAGFDAGAVSCNTRAATPFREARRLTPVGPNDQRSRSQGEGGWNAPDELTGRDSTSFSFLDLSRSRAFRVRQISF